jgi:hypothetical protein
MKSGFIKRNLNFEKSKELKGRAEKFIYLFMAYTLTHHILPLQIFCEDCPFKHFPTQISSKVKKAYRVQL